MKITLNKVTPTPLASIKHGENSIWGKEVVLEPRKKIMLNAASGKGKSTFTHTTYGLRYDYDGDILYGNRSVRTFSTDEWTDLRRTKIAVVFQDLQLFPHLTVRENLMLKNDLTGSFTEEQLLEKLRILGLEDKWNQRCGLLSMGQQQRVAIIRALAQPYEWLIMDEPFSHLDEGNTQLCLQMIDERTDELGAGFVLTTLGNDHSFQFDYVLNL